MLFCYTFVVLTITFLHIFNFFPLGTGWSSKIPNYDPRQIIANLRHIIAGEEMEEMHPFYSGFVGEIVPEGGGKFQV